MPSNSSVHLRPLVNNDIPYIADLANNKLIWLNLRDRFPHPYSKADAKWYVDYVKSNKTEYVLGIAVERQLAGVVGVIYQEDVYAGVGEIGYWIGQPYWGRGVMTQAIRLFIEVCQNELSFRRLEACVFSSNPASMSVLIANGFIKEGIRKSRIIKDGQVLDEHLFGLVLS